MKIKHFILLLLGLFLVDGLSAQSKVKGYVVEMHQPEGEEAHEMGVPGVKVSWKGTDIFAVTDPDGKFKIKTPDSWPATLMFEFVGYPKDSIELKQAPESAIKVTLKNSRHLEGVEITAKQRSTMISLVNPFNLETLGQGELKKAACCNLSESFETNASVDVNFADAVSGAKTIQMLGLDGAYSQIMFENIPMVRGLETKYGLTLIPGTWINSIQVTKGAGSVVNGYESITGQLNIEYHKPDDKDVDRYFLNVYGNANARLEGNVHFRQKINDNWSTMLFGHAMTLKQQNDNNDDGFMDVPMTDRYAAFNRWKYRYDKIMGQFGGSASYMNNVGGQMGFDPANVDATDPKYGVGVEALQWHVFNKTGILFPNHDHRSIGLIGMAKRYDQNSYFGNRTYNARQDYAYFNAIYQSVIGSPAHGFKTGLSYVYDDYTEAYNDSSFSRIERVPGAFFEYTYKLGEEFDLIAGIRADQHNLYGLQVNPRVHTRWAVSNSLVLRASAGRGFRRPNIFAENMSVLASSRQVVVLEDVRPEEAINAGGSVTWELSVLKRPAVLRADFYHTNFINQIIVDLDQDARKVYFYNLDGTSYSNSFQIDFGIEPFERFDIKTAYKRTEVVSTYSGVQRLKPLVPIDRVMFNAAYKTKNEIWDFDATFNWYGTQRLPVTTGSPAEYQIEPESKDYYTLSAQVTKEFRHFEIYLGAENILNFRQMNPIVSADDPFGEFFDASMIWGPVNGRVIYAGLRTIIR